MVNKKTEYPYCRRCNETRSDPKKWAKFTTRGLPRKVPSCGKCGQMLAWGPRASDIRIRTSNVPDNIERDKDTKTDIRDNAEKLKQILDEGNELHKRR